MNEQEKNSLLLRARDNLSRVRQVIAEKLSEARASAKQIETRLPKLFAAELKVQTNLLKGYEKRAAQLGAMYPSPYFVKCSVRFDGETQSRIFYFSKFTLPEEQIYSWVTPAASMRFEAPGAFSYLTPEGEKSGELLLKEQYMVVDGRIVYMSFESTEQERELVFQEYFSTRKTAFALPEIVEQMEKAQDKVVRAKPTGAFLISGPAGSGKTTLALHRVAYLLQSPDFAGRFKEKDIAVFVQDIGTKAYFGKLLPELGVEGVTITTFSEWVLTQLKLFEFGFVNRYGSTEDERDLLEYEKYQAIKQAGKVKYTRSARSMLESVYESRLSTGSKEVFRQQMQSKVLDRFDLTLLAQSFVETRGGVFRSHQQVKQLPGGKVERKTVEEKFAFSLLVLDEVQNYLPEQIQVLQKCLNAETGSLVYVGDLAQQTRLCTLKSWESVGESFTEQNSAVLQKNYRSTRQIQEYLKTLGFKVSVDSKAKSGEQVVEVAYSSVEEELRYIQNLVKEKPGVTVGILAKNKDYLKPFVFESANVHVLSIAEAQGVEFDVVCLVGVSKDNFAVSKLDSKELDSERVRVNKDLLYVGLSRAMNELHVLGEEKLSSIF